MAFGFFKRDKKVQPIKESVQAKTEEVQEPETRSLTEVEIMQSIPDSMEFVDYCISLTYDKETWEQKKDLSDAIYHRFRAEKGKHLFAEYKEGMIIAEYIITEANSEKIADLALTTLLFEGYFIKRLRNSYSLYRIDEESVQSCLNQFKMLCQNTKHQEIKNIIINLICIYDASLAQYAIENHLLSHWPRSTFSFDKEEDLLRKCLKIIDEKGFTRKFLQSDAGQEAKRIARANTTDRSILKEVAQTGDELTLRYEAAMKLGDPAVLLPFLDSEISEICKYKLLKAMKNHPEALDSKFAVETLKNTTDYERYEEFLSFVTQDTHEEIRNYRKAKGIKLSKPIYEEYEEGATWNERIWSYRIIGYEEVDEP